MVNIPEESPMYFVVFDITRDLLISIICSCSNAEQHEHKKKSPDMIYLETLDSTWREAQNAINRMIDYQSTQEIHTKFSNIHTKITQLIESR